MTGELKSMFDAHLDSSNVNVSEAITEKQRIELEEKKKKEFYKKQSKF
jgi:hypothetical protein